jgi:hypothetical protein
MNRAHCDQCDKADHQQDGWLKLSETVFPKPFPKGLMDDFYGRSIEKDFCSFKCLKEFVATLPDNRKGFSLVELLSQNKSEKRWVVDKDLIRQLLPARIHLGKKQKSK